MTSLSFAGRRSVIARSQVDSRPRPRICRASTALGSPRAFDWGSTACSSLRPRAWTAAREATGRIGSVANRSVLHPTRLETRTKESNMCASHGVFVRNLARRNESEGQPSGRPQVGSPSLIWHVPRGAHYRPVPTTLLVGRSKSVHVGTRKMVNYA